MAKDIETIKARLDQAGKSRTMLQLAIRKLLMDAHQPRLNELVDWVATHMAEAIVKGDYDGDKPENVIWGYTLSYDSMLQIRHMNLRYDEEANHETEIN